MATGDADVTDAEKKEKYTQTYAALSFGFIFVVLGLPLWWKTTEVYRVSLPYGEIEELAKVQTIYSVNVEVICYDKKYVPSLLELSKTLQDKLGRLSENNIKSRYLVSAREAIADEEAVLSAAKRIEDFDERLTQILGKSVNEYSVVLLPGNGKLQIPKPALGPHRGLYLVTKQDTGKLARQIVDLVSQALVREDMLVSSVEAVRGLRSLKPDKESMRAFRSKEGYDVTFTLVSSQPHILNMHWDVEQAVENYLQPLLKKLENFTTLDIKSQVLYYTGFVSRPAKDSSSNSYYYTKKDLPHMINSLETKLVSHASNNPAINFVVFVPPRETSPVFIKDSSGKRVASNAFLSPRWGGILIYNVDGPPANTSLPYDVTIDSTQVMTVFLTQLSLLLNLHAQKQGDMFTSWSGKEVVADWELDAWMRGRCIENLATSTVSLHSLAQLLDRISNIVINDDIGAEVQTAVTAVQRAHRLLQEGRLEEAFQQSKTALLASEKAFFDPSLLELLYFPEDQKFAIYVPLFLPITLPVLASLFKAIKWLRAVKKEKKE